ncbi:MAG: uridine phosphorylase [bacterium]
MNIENINKAYLDKVLKGQIVDHMYHIGVSSNDEILKDVCDVKAVILSGSAHRVERMAKTWAAKHKDSSVLKFPKDERFSVFYSNGVLFSSHGMGMPSMSIAMQELMKLVYLVKNGKIEEIEKVFWCRVGTSGGMVDPGSVVITTEGLLPDFKPYRMMVLGKETYFNSTYPKESIKQIITANINSGIKIIEGKTIGADSFYIEQNRLDGAIVLCKESEKMEWLKKAESLGVKNIEMETPLMSAFLNHWGFPNFAAVCCVLVNRLKGDQVNSTHEELDYHSLNAETVLWNYLL